MRTYSKMEPRGLKIGCYSHVTSGNRMQSESDPASAKERSLHKCEKGD